MACGWDSQEAKAEYPAVSRHARRGFYEDCRAPALEDVFAIAYQLAAAGLPGVLSG